MKKYRVLSDGVQSDKKKQRWEKGEQVTAKDFPKSVLEHWQKIGRLEIIEDGER